MLEARLRMMLGTASRAAILAGEPDSAVTLLSYRPNVWFDGEVALLDELYVVPGHRGQGIGTAIIGLLLRDAAARGVGLLEVNVEEGDVDAQRFYARHGFHMTEPGSDERTFYHWREP